MRRFRNEGRFGQDRNTSRSMSDRGILGSTPSDVSLHSLYQSPDSLLMSLGRTQEQMLAEQTRNALQAFQPVEDPHPKSIFELSQELNALNKNTYDRSNQFQDNMFDRPFGSGDFNDNHLGVQSLLGINPSNTMKRRQDSYVNVDDGLAPPRRGRFDDFKDDRRRSPGFKSFRSVGDEGFDSGFSRPNEFNLRNPAMKNPHSLMRPGSFDKGKNHYDSYRPMMDKPNDQPNVRIQVQQHLRNIERTSTYGDDNSSSRPRPIKFGGHPSRGLARGRGSPRNIAVSDTRKRGDFESKSGGLGNRSNANNRGQSYSSRNASIRGSGRQQPQSKPLFVSKRNPVSTTSRNASKPANAAQPRANIAPAKKPIPSKVAPAQNKNVMVNKSTPTSNKSSETKRISTTNQPTKTMATSPAKPTVSSPVISSKSASTQNSDGKSVAMEDVILNAHTIAEDAESIGEYNEEVAVGQYLVVPVSGFFCKVCHKFYNNKATALSTHCKTKPHYDKVLKFLEYKRDKEIAEALASEFDQPMPIQVKEEKHA